MERIIKTKINGRFEFVILLFIGTILYCWLFFVNQQYLEGIPHVGDAVSYVWEAKFLAEGKLFISPDIFPRYYDFFKGWEPLFFRNGQYFGPYPFGHPLLLVPGVWLGNFGLMPPLIGTIMVIAIYFIIKKFTDWRIAFIGILLTITSPFFQMHAVSFMSHNSAALYVTITILILSKLYKKNTHLSFIGAGMLVGLLLNTRPLASIAFFPAILMYCWHNRQSVKSVVAFLFGFAVLLSFYFISNYLITGNPMSPPYSASLIPMERAFPFITTGKLTIEIDNFKNALILFLRVVNGWPIMATLFFTFLSLCNRRLLFPILLFWVGILCHLVLHFFFFDPGITYGPRMWYEFFPFFIMLTTLGIYNFVHIISLNYHMKIVSGIFVLLLVLRSTIGWITGNPVLYTQFFTPSSINNLKAFNYTDARLIKNAKTKNIHNAVIFVRTNEHCGYQWWCYGSVMAQNNITFDTDIVWAMDLNERNSELKQLYPTRNFYRADYDNNSIELLSP